MFPQGFHPVNDIFLPDITTPASTIPRLDARVKYYFVDYGISSYFPAGSQPQPVLGKAGRDQDVPELSDTVPYDPFKVDIFTIGNVLRREFQNVGFHPPVATYHGLISVQYCSNLGFLAPLTERMTQRVPNSRPSAEQALQEWRTIRARINILHRHWRLRGPTEGLLWASVQDIFHVLKFIPRIFRWIGRMLRRNSA
jgi:hypothetical protein